MVADPNCQPDCRCGEGEPAADSIVWNEVGWSWNGRTYRTIEDAVQARLHPTLTVPHALNIFADVGNHEELPAGTVLSALAGGMAAMMKASSEIGGNELAEEVNKALAVCSIRLRDTAKAIGAAPVDMDGF